MALKPTVRKERPSDRISKMLREADGRTGAACVGMAALWLCLQASGFYPLSMLPAIESYSAQTVAGYHLLYTGALVIFTTVAMIVRKAAQRLLDDKTFALSLGASGIVGHFLLTVVSPTPTFSLTIAFGTIAVAFFILFSVLFWARRLAGNDTPRMLSCIAFSYLIAQFVSVLWFALDFSQNALLIISAAISGCCSAAMGPANLEEEGPGTKHSICQLPWSMLAPTLFTIYFCEVFIRLRIGDFGGDAPVSRKIITSVIAGGAFTIVLTAMLATRERDAERILILTFAMLVIAYLVALLAMLIFDSETKSSTNRLLIACSHCMEVFLWMVTLRAVNEKGISPVAAFGLLIIVAIAIPWALSFDAYYLLGFDSIVSDMDILLPGVALALLVTTASTIVFLIRYAFKETLHTAALPEPEGYRALVYSTLEKFNLTNREFEVAEYLYRGYSAKKIANILFLSEASIRAHTMHIYRKMDIHSKQELISYIDEN